MNKLLKFFFFDLLGVLAVTRHDHTIPQVKLHNFELTLCASKDTYNIRLRRSRKLPSPISIQPTLEEEYRPFPSNKGS